MRLAALLLGVGLSLGLCCSSRAALAFEREWHLGVGAGVANGNDLKLSPAVAAYAAASMAGSDPFRTGNTAFRLALAKALVPFVFVFSPSLLIVVPEFNWYDFLITFAGCIVGITMLGAAFSAWLLTPLQPWERWWLGLASLPTIAPGVTSTVIGVAAAVR